MNQTAFFQSWGMPQELEGNHVAQEENPKVEDRSWEAFHPLLIPVSALEGSSDTGKDPVPLIGDQPPRDEASGRNDCFGEFSPKTH